MSAVVSHVLFNGNRFVSVFSIDAAVGTIRLEIALSRDTSEYNITVLVKDSTDTLTANSYELNIGFVVNSK